MTFVDADSLVEAEDLLPDPDWDDGDGPLLAPTGLAWTWVLQSALFVAVVFATLPYVLLVLLHIVGAISFNHLLWDLLTRPALFPSLFLLSGLALAVVVFLLPSLCLATEGEVQRCDLLLPSFLVAFLVFFLASALFSFVVGWQNSTYNQLEVVQQKLVICMSLLLVGGLAIAGGCASVRVGACCPQRWAAGMRLILFSISVPLSGLILLKEMLVPSGSGGVMDVFVGVCISLPSS